MARQQPTKASIEVHQGCLEAEGEKTSVMLAGDVSHVMCMKFMPQGSAWGHVQQCFVLAVRVDVVTVFGNVMTMLEGKC